MYELTEYDDSAQLSPKYVTNLTHTKYVHKTVLPNGKVTNMSSNFKPTFVEILVDHNIYFTGYQFQCLLNPLFSGYCGSCRSSYTARGM